MNFQCYQSPQYVRESTVSFLWSKNTHTVRNDRKFTKMLCYKGNLKLTKNVLNLLKFFLIL